MTDFIQQLPKAELHLHIEGALEPELMFELAQRNHVKLPYDNIAAVKQAYQFTNLQSFLDIYYASAAVLIHEQDFYDLTYAYCTRVVAQGVRHVEIFFDPQTHTERGIAFEIIITGMRRALVDAKNNLSLSGHLICCFLRHLSEAEAIKTLQQALPFKDWIIAVGLDSSELEHPPEKFARVFAQARDAGFFCVAHAGEEGPPEYIWQALTLLKVSRIDHGLRCLEDPALVAYLIEHKIPLTVCPLSNVKLQSVASMEQHPIKMMFDQGILVTINSDDPAYFRGYINENYQACEQALQFSKKDLSQIAANSIEASFLTAAEKKLFKSI